MYIGLHVRYPSLLLDFSKTRIFSTNFPKKNPQTSNFMEIRLVGDELFPADGKRDMTKLTDAFRNFTNAPENQMSKTGMSVLYLRHERSLPACAEEQLVLRTHL